MDVKALILGGGFAGLEAASRLRRAGLDVTLVCNRPLLEGNGASHVHRDGPREQMIPPPGVGHWMQQAWGSADKASKHRQIPRLPEPRLR